MSNDDFPKDENGDWDWRNDRERRPRLIQAEKIKDEVFQEFTRVFPAKEERYKELFRDEKSRNAVADGLHLVLTIEPINPDHTKLIELLETWAKLEGWEFT